jgi:hypothetical protein
MSMSFRSSLILRSLAGFVAASCFATSAANAAFITEYFDYGGTGGTTIGGKGDATGGWAGAWIGTGSGYNATQTYSTANLTYTAVGYANTGNDSSTGIATANTATIQTAPQVRHIDGGLGGTIWISFLARSTNVASGGNGEALVGFNQTSPLNGSDSVLGLLRNAAVVRWKSGSTTLVTPSAETTYLFLAKIEMNVSGADDRITAWVNPDLTSLGTGEVRPLADIGTALASIAVLNTTSGSVDAIRISNDVDGFAKVTAVPEPASLSLLALAGCVAMRRRRAM